MVAADPAGLLAFNTIVGSNAIPIARLPSACSLTCEERSVTETGVSFAEVRRRYAGAAWGMFIRLMR